MSLRFFLIRGNLFPDIHLYAWIYCENENFPIGIEKCSIQWPNLLKFQYTSSSVYR